MFLNISLGGWGLKEFAAALCQDELHFLKVPNAVPTCRL